MKSITLAEDIATSGDTDVTISLDTPQTRGRDAILVIQPSDAFAGSVAFSDADGNGTTYVDQIAAMTLTTGKGRSRSVKVPELARITVVRSAGSVSAYLHVGE